MDPVISPVNSNMWTRGRFKGCVEDEMAGKDVYWSPLCFGLIWHAALVLNDDIC